MHRAIAATTLAAFLIAPGAGLQAADQPPFVINAVLSTTGPAAFTGQAQARSLQLVEEAVNRQGGIKGRPIKFVVADDQSSPQVALQLITRLIDQQASVVIGPSVAGTCSAAMPLVSQRGPMLWCMSPALAPPAGSYVFSSGPTLDAAGMALVRFMREHGWTRLAAISSTDGSGQAFDHAIAFALAQPENTNVQMLLYEHMNPSDISVAGQVARIKAANPQAILTLATGTPWATIMHGISDAGIDVPIGGGHGNASYEELSHYKAFMPRELYFPGLASVAPNSVGRGPIQQAQDAFFAAFQRAGLKPDIPLTTAWDPAMIIVSALRTLGTSASAQQIRDYVLNLHGWTGVEGVYDFSDGLQRGVTVRAIVIDRWDKDKETFAAVSRPGGYLR